MELSTHPSSTYENLETYHKTYRPWEYDSMRLESIKQGEFHTHGNHTRVELIYRANEVIAMPWKKTLQFFAYSVEPFPGKDKESSRWKYAVVRVSSVAFSLLLAPIGIVSNVLSVPLRGYTHIYRPRVSYLYTNSVENVMETKTGEPFHIRTLNLGFSYEFHRILDNLRPTLQRSREIGRWIIEDRESPEVICFQEAFHEDGVRLLCEMIRERYPFIIHNISPNMMGLNSGLMVASKYPIKETDFHPFDNIIGPEKLSSRGVFRFRIEREGCKIDVYTTHLQALVSQERVRIRKQQLETILCCMEEDKKKLEEKADIQILAGDLNASRETTWGLFYSEDHEFLENLQKNFEDPFLLDHDEEGNRTSSLAKYVEMDSPDKQACLKEPKGSWCYGIDLRSPFKRLCNGVVYDLPKRRRPKMIMERSTWGTSKWAKVQGAFTARLDYLLRKKEGISINLKDRAEIRRIRVLPTAQSAPSDHLPVDGEFWITPRKCFNLT